MSAMEHAAEESNLRYEGWRVVAATGIGVFFASLFLYTFPVFLRPLADEFSWSREAISAAYAAMTLASAISAPVVGHLFDRRGPGWICGPCMAVAACAFASLAVLTPRLWHLYAVFALVGLAVTGTSYVVYSRVVSGWFDARRGLALASMVASSGVGGIVFPPAAQALITLTGWRTAYLILGGLAAGMGLPVVLKFVRERTSAGRETRRPDTRGIIGNALRSRILWTLLVVVFGTTMAINGAIVHLSALLTDRGMSPDSAAVVLSAMGVASLTGRLATGWLLDRFVATRVSFVLLAIAALGTFTLAGAQSTAAGVIAAALIGFGTGGEVDVFPYLLSRYFGLAALSTLIGVAWMAFGVAGAAGPILLGRAYDATGSYELVLMFAAAGALAMGALMLSLPACERHSPSAARRLGLF